MYNVGDMVKINLKDANSIDAKARPGQVFTITDMGHSKGEMYLNSKNFVPTLSVWAKDVTIYKKGENNMLKSIGSDLRDFIKENKSVIYWIAVAMVADHVFFKGAFREKLHGLMNKLLGKVEAQIEAKAD